ncbi:MAG: MvdC/MvdD family ATP grasp protein [Pseudonocardiaceae bacterium]
MTVLILAREIEPQVDRVAEELAAREVPVFRTNLAAFPQTLTLDARLEPGGWDGTLATEHRTVRLRDIRSVWYRHPSHFQLPEGMSRPERRHAAAEARVGVAGVLCSLDVLWVNYPSRESDALKPRQLDVARRCGLRVPPTLITNNPAGVRDFAAVVGGPLAGKNRRVTACASTVPNGSGTASSRPRPSGMTKVSRPTNASASPPHPMTSTSGTAPRTGRTAGHCGRDEPISLRDHRQRQLCRWLNLRNPSRHHTHRSRRATTTSTRSPCRTSPLLQ